MSNETKSKIKSWLGGSFVTAVLMVVFFFVSKIELAGQYKNQVENNTRDIELLKAEMKEISPAIARIEERQKDMQEFQKAMLETLKKK